MAEGPVTIRIKGKEYLLSRSDVENAARLESPRRVNSYFVEIGGKRFPPKQLLRLATNSEAVFDTSLAIRALRHIGFDVIEISDT